MDWSYITGYFDGEGSVGIYSGAVQLTWHNTHRESLEAMREYMGCGVIRERLVGRNKPMYGLHVHRARDQVRVIEAMLPYSIIKRDRLIVALAWARGRKELSGGWGALSAAGPDRIRELYDSGLTQKQIGQRHGVTQSAVKAYMQRHGIPTRPRSEYVRTAHRDSERWAARTAYLSDLRRAQWADPEYRARQMKMIRATQEQRVATRRARGWFRRDRPID